MRKPVPHNVPLDKNSLRLKKPKKQAAGIPAVVSSGIHSLKKMGVANSVRTLRMVNQKMVLTVLVVLGQTLNTEQVSNFVKTVLKPLLMKQQKARLVSRFSLNILSKNYHPKVIFG